MQVQCISVFGWPWVGGNVSGIFVMKEAIVSHPLFEKTYEIEGEH